MTFYLSSPNLPCADWDSDESVNAGPLLRQDATEAPNAAETSVGGRFMIVLRSIWDFLKRLGAWVFRVVSGLFNKT